MCTAKGFSSTEVTLPLGSCAVRCAGSSPVARTNEKSDFIGLFCFRKKAVWQTQRIGTPAVSLRNKHSLRQIPLCIIAILMPLEFGVEVDFDVEFFIFLGDNDAVYQQPKISVADSSLLNDLLN